MKKLAQHIGIYALSLNILLASIGVPLYKRSCVMPNMKDVTSLFQKPLACCEELHQNEPSFRHLHQQKPVKPINPCCQFTSELLNVDFFAQDLGHDAFKLSPVFLFSDFLHCPSFYLWYPSDVDSIILYTDSSPPISGRQIIQLKQSFLI